jgi:hypothetical protein
VLREERERALDRVVGSAERGAAVLVEDLPPRRRRPRRPAVAEVEHGEVRARGRGARRDRCARLAEHRALREPRQRLRVKVHRRPPVGDDDDARAEANQSIDVIGSPAW